MKTALKIIGGIVLTLVLAIVVVYIGWLRPPSAAKVCDNVEKITIAELKSQGIDAPDAMKSELRKDCEKWATKRPKFGLMPWVKHLKCARDAEDVSELKACKGKS